MDRNRLTTIEEINEVLDAAIEAGAIYNVDLKPIKSDIDRLFDKDRYAVGDIHASVSRMGGDTSEMDNDLYWAFPYGIANVTSKKFAKTLDAAGDTAYANATREFVARWSPVAEKLKALKPMIVKGRKPSETPRKTPERTLDNTGTCGVCGQNVKRDAQGRIVHHGFQVRWNERQGRCPGTGYQPIEVSDESLHAFLKAMQDMRETTERSLLYFQNTPDAPVVNWRGRTIKSDDISHRRERENHMYKLAQTIRQLSQEIERTEQRIAGWEPAPLPDQKAA